MVHSATPSPTLATHPTVLSGPQPPAPQLPAPRITPSPSSCAPNELVIEIATTVLVPDYTRFYDTPISEFHPSYFALPDGSLASVPFMQDLTRSYLSLLVTAMLATLFLRNIIVCVDYLRRANMKRRTLFHLLLCSQLLSMGLAPLLASYFNSRLDCTAVTAVAAATTGISLALLVILSFPPVRNIVHLFQQMSGILGLKAYRCLDSSRAVLLVLVAFLCASSAFLVLHLASIRGLHRLSGGCSTISNAQFLRIYVLIQLAHSFFICCCFLYAVWKSRASPAARGRLSVRVTLDDFPDVEFGKPTSRNWWKHLLGRRNTTNLPALDVSSPAAREDLPSNIPPSVSSEEQTASARLRRPIRSGAFNLSYHNVSDAILEQPLVERQSAPCPRPTSILRFIPRMELFHEVMKDELCYTTTITVTTVILALLLVLGVNFENGLEMTDWVAANEAIISFLVIHSFGRVVRRHERDALFQHPSAWWSERDRSPYLRRGLPGMVRAPEDPFSDARGVRDSTPSWNSNFSASPSSPSRAASRDRRPSLPSLYADFERSRNTILDLPPSHNAGQPFGWRGISGTSIDEKNV
ncbi:hypothetical protein GGX14DRAFT_489964 [Mycena pura]|uniref:Uncharacterized protein n=1 Tax=Mycena pura TaxID=153505 RepID=A0AAD7E2Y0_9AGAR|nr:hypothetical protein GGX14DRAFT_489964 [Mycena pura]